MPDAITLRLLPNVLRSGERATVRAEFFPPALLGKRCGLKLVEVDEQGRNPTDLAAFQVVLGRSGSVLRFTASERDGAATAPPEGTPTLRVVFEGVAGEHVVGIERPRTAPEGRFFELGVKVLDPAGAEVYPAGKPLPFTRLDCGPVGSRYGRLNCRALNFSNDSAVVQDDGVYVLYGALEYARTHRESRLLVLSHTDSVGGEADNDALSDLRAKSVLYLLRGSHAGDRAANRAGWVDACKRRWAARDVQQFLTWVQGFSWAGRLDPGPLSSDRGEARRTLPERTRRALLELDARFRAHFQDDEVPPPTDAQVKALGDRVPDAFWGQVYDVYSEYLRQLLSIPSDAKLDAFLKGVAWLDATSDDTRSIGCGERYPLEKEQGTQGSLANRRTELLFFVAGGERPVSLRREDLAPLYAAEWQVDLIDCPDPKTPPEIVFDLPKTKDLLVVIDVSGSMRATDGLQGIEDNWRLSRVKRALLKLLDDHARAHPDALIDLLAFGGAAEADADPDPSKRPVQTWRGQLSPLDGSARDWIAQLQPRGGTPTGLALLKALRDTRGPGGAAAPARLTVLLLSDGMPDGQPGRTAAQVKDDVLTQVQQRRQSTRPGWVLETYGFRSGDGGRRLDDFMQRLATQNGGTFHAL